MNINNKYLKYKYKYYKLKEIYGGNLEELIARHTTELKVIGIIKRVGIDNIVFKINKTIYLIKYSEESIMPTINIIIDGIQIDISKDIVIPYDLKTTNIIDYFRQILYIYILNKNIEAIRLQLSRLELEIIDQIEQDDIFIFRCKLADLDILVKYNINKQDIEQFPDNIMYIVELVINGNIINSIFLNILEFEKKYYKLWLYCKIDRFNISNLLNYIYESDGLIISLESISFFFKDIIDFKTKPKKLIVSFNRNKLNNFIEKKFMLYKFRTKEQITISKFLFDNDEDIDYYIYEKVLFYKKSGLNLLVDIINKNDLFPKYINKAFLLKILCSFINVSEIVNYILMCILFGTTEYYKSDDRLYKEEPLLYLKDDVFQLIHDDGTIVRTYEENEHSDKLRAIYREWYAS